MTKKPVIGRPLRAPSPSDERIVLRVTREEHARWAKASLALGVTLSQFVRDSINKKVNHG